MIVNFVLSIILGVEDMVNSIVKNFCFCGIYIWKCRYLGFGREGKERYMFIRFIYIERRVEVIRLEVSFLRLWNYWGFSFG